jgi:hypothetical protein
MGYSMWQRHGQVRIGAAQKGAAYTALVPLCDEYPVRDVDGHLPIPATLEDLLERYGWDTTHDAEGNIIDLFFSGDKYGSLEDELLPLLAPFIEPDSYLIMEGEDGAIWRWLFRDSAVVQQEGFIVFDDPPARFPSARSYPTMEQDERQNAPDDDG